jgi:hypothetical protein
MLGTGRLITNGFGRRILYPCILIIFFCNRKRIYNSDTGVHLSKWTEVYINENCNRGSHKNLSNLRHWLCTAIFNLNLASLSFRNSAVTGSIFYSIIIN